MELAAKQFPKKTGSVWICEEEKRKTGMRVLCRGFGDVLSISHGKGSLRKASIECASAPCTTKRQKTVCKFLQRNLKFFSESLLTAWKQKNQKNSKVYSYSYKNRAHPCDVSVNILIKLENGTSTMTRVPPSWVLSCAVAGRKRVLCRYAWMH